MLQLLSIVLLFFSKWKRRRARVVTWHVYVDAYLLAWVLCLTSSFHSPESGGVVWKASERYSGIVSICSTSQSQGYTVLFSPFESMPPSPQEFQFQLPQHISDTIASCCNLLPSNWKIPRCEVLCVCLECAGWLLTSPFLHLFTSRSSDQVYASCFCYNNSCGKGKKRFWVEKLQISQSREAGRWPWSH